MGAFADSVRMNSDAMLKKVQMKVYVIARTLFIEIVKATPSPTHPGLYAKGLLANQWYPTAGSGFSTESTEETDAQGRDSIDRIVTVIDSTSGVQFMGKDGTVTLANNLSYAYRAEALGWLSPEWSGKTGSDGNGGGYHMVALSLQNIAAMFK